MYDYPDFMKSTVIEAVPRRIVENQTLNVEWVISAKYTSRDCRGGVCGLGAIISKMIYTPGALRSIRVLSRVSGSL